MAESKRVKNLRDTLIKQIPRSPNNKQSLKELQSKSLTDLLIVYANWVVRYITPRQRKVVIEPTANKDPRWNTLYDKISSFLQKVESGKDLTPHLSLDVHKKGFSPASSGTCPDTDKWADKDFLLNVMGYHHFHIGDKQEDKNHVERTDDVLFAEVNRNRFRLVAIFNHSVFKTNRDITQSLTTERQRLWRIFDERSFSDVPSGSVVIPSIIMTSGHSLNIVRRVQDYINVIKEIDPKLSELNFVRELFEKSEVPIPKKYKLSWHFRFLDLGVFDETSKTYFVFRYGVN